MSKFTNVVSHMEGFVTILIISNYKLVIYRSKVNYIFDQKLRMNIFEWLQRSSVLFAVIGRVFG